jgi:hypothetical protein
MNNILSPNSTKYMLFFVQVAVILIVVITSIVNLTLERGNTNLWTALLSSCLGYILPNPKIGTVKPTTGFSTPSSDNGVVHHDTPIEHEGGE